jgi:hypothetical protein
MTDWLEQYSAALFVRDAREQVHKPYVDACTSFHKIANTTSSNIWLRRVSSHPPRRTRRVNHDEWSSSIHILLAHSNIPPNPHLHTYTTPFQRHHHRPPRRPRHQPKSPRNPNCQPRNPHHPRRYPRARIRPDDANPHPSDAPKVTSRTCVAGSRRGVEGEGEVGARRAG